MNSNVKEYDSRQCNLVCDVTDMVKTRSGNSTTMELSEDILKHLDSRFDQVFFFFFVFSKLKQSLFFALFGAKLV